MQNSYDGIDALAVDTEQNVVQPVIDHGQHMLMNGVPRPLPAMLAYAFPKDRFELYKLDDGENCGRPTQRAGGLSLTSSAAAAHENGLRYVEPPPLTAPV